MGRQIHRVPVDFDWPTDKIWEGYLRPAKFDGIPCTECRHGQTFAGWWLQQWCQRLTMMARDAADHRSGRDQHPWLAADAYPPGQFDESGKYIVDRVSPDMIDLVAGLTDQTPEQVAGFPGGNDHYLYRKLAEVAGLPKFGHCNACDGRGTTEAYPGQYAEGEAWEPVEPPTGDGWQLWETVSDGSPISPVFPDREGLVGWLMSPANGWGISRPMTRAQAEAFTAGDGWAPSMVMTGGQLIPGEQWVADQDGAR